MEVERPGRPVGKLTLIVQHDCQDRDVISLRNPVNTARNGEEERAIADNLADEFFLALVIFGPKKLPEIARQVGKVLNEFRRASNEFKAWLEEQPHNGNQQDREGVLLKTGSTA